MANSNGIFDHYQYNGVVDQGTVYPTLTNGSTYVTPDNISCVHFVPTAILAATIVLPVNPNDQQLIRYASHATVTAMTVTANSPASVVGSVSGLGLLNTFFAFKYNAANTTWYREY